MKYAIVKSELKVALDKFKDLEINDGCSLSGLHPFQEVIKEFNSQSEALGLLKDLHSLIEFGNIFVTITEYYFALKCDGGFYEPWEFASWEGKNQC